MKQSMIRFILFLIAYIPIYVITALKSIDCRLVNDKGAVFTWKEVAYNNKISISLILLTILLIAYFQIYSRLVIKPKGNPIFEIQTIKQQHKEYITYLGTYILPFVALKPQSFFDMLAVVFMFLTIGFIYSKSNLIYTNPTLTLFGFDIYEVEDNEGNKYDCITKDKLVSGDKPRGIKLGDKTFILSKWKNKHL